MRNLRFIWQLIRYKFSRMMMYRADFFGVFIADGLLFVIQLLTFEAIYSQVDRIGDWNRGQMIIFVGTFSIINALNMLIYFFGILDIPGKIKRGDLDQYITKPVNPLLRLTFENINVGCIPLVVMSVLIVCYGIGVSGIEVSPAVVFGYIALVLLMTLLWYDMEVVLRTIPFFFLSANGVIKIEEQLIDLNFKVPGILYKGGFKVIFYFLLPYGIMSTVPTQFLTQSISPFGVITAVITVILFTAITISFWNFGLKHYKSASS